MRPLCTILASLALVTNLLGAQRNKSQSSASESLSTIDANATILRLLQQSHDLGQQLSVSERLMNLLPRQAEMVSQLRQLPDDDKRAGTMLEVARSIAGDYPVRAADLIAETQRGNKPADDETYVNMISAQAFAAAAQNKKDELHELLQRGFDSAYRIILEQQGTGGMHFVAGLGPLVQIGIQNDPDLTISFIESLSPSYLKAQLLLGAALALSPQMRLPLSSRPQQRVEKLPGALR